MFTSENSLTAHSISSDNKGICLIDACLRYPYIIKNFSEFFFIDNLFLKNKTLITKLVSQGFMLP